MQDWFKSRFPLFFAPGTFELSSLWDERINYKGTFTDAKGRYCITSRPLNLFLCLL